MSITESTLLRFFSGLAILLLVGSLSSCDPNRVYEKNKDIPDYQWKYDNVLAFPFSIKDTNALYNIYVNMRHTHFFPYRNIWLKVKTQFPKGKQLEKRVEIKLANEKGKWYSDCAGDICDYQVAIQENAYFDQKGEYKIHLEQNMRQNPLPGIMDMGIRVEKTGKTKQELANQGEKAAEDQEDNGNLP
jgi:gliding motility-associated lipoprotein GldH